MDKPRALQILSHSKIILTFGRNLQQGGYFVRIKMHVNNGKMKRNNQVTFVFPQWPDHGRGGGLSILKRMVRLCLKWVHKLGSLLDVKLTLINRCSLYWIVRLTSKNIMTF